MISNHQHSSTTQEGDIRQTLGVDSSAHGHKQYVKWGVLVVVTVVIVTVIWQMLAGDDSQNIHYQTAEVSRGNLRVTVTATGSLQPVNEVDVGSEISGTIKTVLVDFNDRVKQGQVLATLDVDQLQAKVNQAKASLELARAKVKQSEATVIETRNKLSRSRELAKSGMCSEEDCDAAQASYDRALADLASSRAQVAQALASLEAEQTTLAKTIIHSPIDGIVLLRDVEPGQTVAASFQTPVLFTLAETLTQMELHVDVDEADVGQVKAGQSATFTVDAYAHQDFPAKITEVHFASQTVDGVVTYETVLSVDNSDLLLRPGMTATADILVKQVDNALLVPNAALRFSPPEIEPQAAGRSGGLLGSLLPRPPRPAKSREDVSLDKHQQQVWILRNGQPVAIAVTTGSSDGVMTEITSSELEAGMILITDTISTKS